MILLSLVDTTLIVREGCLPVRESERIAWKYDDDCCEYGQVETEAHVLF